MGGGLPQQRDGAPSVEYRGGASSFDVEGLARALGWFSIGLGLAEIVAARGLSRSLGMGRSAGLVRAFGIREVATGVGILSRPSAASWVRGRVFGDALDLATLGTTVLRPGNPKQGRAALALAAVAGITVLDVFCANRLDESTPASPAQGPEVEGAITIGKPAEELYQRLRDPQTLAQLLADIATVCPSSSGDGGGRMHWRVKGPLGRAYEWDTEIVDDHPGEAIGWKSLSGAPVPCEVSARLRPATGGRGTVVALRIRLDPPAGPLGDAVFNVLGSTPLSLAADKALHRFKSLVETGEIPTTARQPAARADTR